MSGYELSVDFGTSNTVAAVRRLGERPESLRLSARSDAMPSAVTLFQGQVRTGDEAMHVAAIDYASFERTPKRRLGPTPVLLGGQVHDPVDLVSAVLRHVLVAAQQRAAGSLPTRVLLTHPASWSQHQCDRLRTAAQRAGYPPRLVLVPEPIAAAYAHTSHTLWRRGTRYAVLDFGGGTFDAAVLLAVGGDERPEFVVEQVSGVDPLGGDDFDGLVEDWAIAQARASGRSDLAAAVEADIDASLALREQARQAKEALSSHPSSPVVVAAGSDRLVLTLTQDELEDMLRPHIARAVEKVRPLVVDPASSVVVVDQVFITGGSCLIPLVQREFQRVCGGRVASLGDPKALTAQGALLVPAPGRAADPAPAPQHSAPQQPAHQQPAHQQPAAPLPVGVAPAAPARVALGATDPGATQLRPFVQTTTGPSPVMAASPAPQSSGRARRGLTRPLIVLGLVLAAIIGIAVVVNQVQRHDTVGPTPSPTVTMHSASEASDCPKLKASQCAIVTNDYVRLYVVPSSCVSEQSDPNSSLVLKCTPRKHLNVVLGDRSGGSEHPPVVFVSVFPAGSDLRSLTNEAVKKTFNQDPTTWNSKPSEPPSYYNDTVGGVWLFNDQSTPHLVWTHDSLAMRFEVVSQGDSASNVYTWFTNPPE